jgi:hypothetical protein
MQFGKSREVNNHCSGPPFFVSVDSRVPVPALPASVISYNAASICNSSIIFSSSSFFQFFVRFVAPRFCLLDLFLQPCQLCFWPFPVAEPTCPDPVRG